METSTAIASCLAIVLLLRTTPARSDQAVAVKATTTASHLMNDCDFVSNVRMVINIAGAKETTFLVMRNAIQHVYQCFGFIDGVLDSLSVEHTFMPDITPTFCDKNDDFARAKEIVRQYPPWRKSNSGDMPAFLFVREALLDISRCP